jgi:hypothetical protein
MYIIIQMVNVAILQTLYSRHAVFSQTLPWNFWATNGTRACNLYTRRYRPIHVSERFPQKLIVQNRIQKCLPEIFIHLPMVYLTVLSIVDVKLYCPQLRMKNYEWKWTEKGVELSSRVPIWSTTAVVARETEEDQVIISPTVCHQSEISKIGIRKRLPPFWDNILCFKLNMYFWIRSEWWLEYCYLK